MIEVNRINSLTMKFQKIITLTFTIVFVTVAAFGATATAYADCSYNGFLNSKGKCSSSYKYDWDRDYSYRNYDDDDDDRYDDDNRYNYSYNFADYDLLAMIRQLQALILLLEDRVDTSSNDESEVSVTTRAAIDIEDDSATLRGRVYLDGEGEAEVYFEYGRSRTDLDKETDSEIIEEDDSSFTFSEEVTGLREDTFYYYRAVAEDEDGDEDYGSVYSFRTDSDSDDNDLPDVDTRQAEDITDHEAEIHGRVDMNDFDNGDVFFVHGEDESQVEDVADEYDDYSDVDEDGDDLQKALVDNDLDDTGSYQHDIGNLDDDTRIYYALCVAFEDEDNDEVIECGDTESFWTDED